MPKMPQLEGEPNSAISFDRSAPGIAAAIYSSITCKRSEAQDSLKGGSVLEAYRETYAKLLHVSTCQELLAGKCMCGGKDVEKGKWSWLR